MKKYMLISVVEREMGYAFYETLKEAQEQMLKEFENSCVDTEEYIEEQMAQFNEMSAWITDGNNHDNFDWWIVDLTK